jgi:hypothetical protein
MFEGMAIILGFQNIGMINAKKTEKAESLP